MKLESNCLRRRPCVRLREVQFQDVRVVRQTERTRLSASEGLLLLHRVTVDRAGEILLVRGSLVY